MQVAAVVLRVKVAALELAFIHVIPDRVDVVERRCKWEPAAYPMPRALCCALLTESPNDPFVHGDLLQSHLAPAAGSSPRRPTSVPSSYFDHTLAKLVGKWFRQIIPLGIRHAFPLGTNDIPLLRAPRLLHILGAPGPKPQAVPQLFAHAEEAALGISLNSFNAQSPKKMLCHHGRRPCLR